MSTLRPVERHASIILAAGTGARIGTLKQLLPYRAKTLLEHSIDEAVAAGFAPILVVVGAGAQDIRDLIGGRSVEIVENASWEAGMGSSIAAGMRALLKRDELPSAVAMLAADQPLVQARHLSAMRDLMVTSGAESVAAEYKDIVGVPALFRAELFSALASLPPGVGARNLLRRAGIKVVRFPLPEAAVDIDTREDFERLTSAAPLCRK